MKRIKKYLSSVALLGVLVHGTNVVAMSNNIKENNFISIVGMRVKDKLNEFDAVCKSSNSNELLKELSNKLDDEFDKILLEVIYNKTLPSRINPWTLKWDDKKGGYLKRYLYSRKGKEPNHYYASPDDVISKACHFSYLKKNDLYKIGAGLCAMNGVLIRNILGRGTVHCMIHYDESKNFTNVGWKIHLSPNLLFCSEVLKIVNYLHSDMKFNYKTIVSLPCYRSVNAFSENRGCEYGKFITIYPSSDMEACKIVERLHYLFEKVNINADCFLEVPNDFKIYDGIYTRLTYYRPKAESEKEDDERCRSGVGIGTVALKEHSK